MQNIGIDKRAAGVTPDGGLLAPAVLAERVVQLTTDQTGIRVGTLPIWDRLEARPSRLGAWLRRLALVAAWCTTLALLALAALRIFSHDATTLLTWINAFTLYVYLPAYLVVVLAAANRRWWLFAASGAVVACHLAWVAPDFRPPIAYVPPATESPGPQKPLRIFYANIRTGNTEFTDTLAEVVAADPDIIVFAELHRPWFQYLQKWAPLEAYSYGTQFERRHHGDVNIYSRVPLSRMQWIIVANRVCVIADVPRGNETLRLVGLHSPRPLPAGQSGYVEYWREIEPLLSAQNGPLVVIGDFNATQYSLVYERLTSGRLRSAHEDRGRGYAATWPNGWWSLPPIRIDQALLSPEVECISIAEGMGTNSDHKPLVLDVLVHSQPAATPTPIAQGR